MAQGPAENTAARAGRCAFTDRFLSPGPQPPSLSAGRHILAAFQSVRGAVRRQRDSVSFGYRFRSGVDDADPMGRSVPAFPFTPGDRHRLALGPSLIPPWYEGNDREQRCRDEYQPDR
ncbi:hypothetical protein [Streptomyces sp. NPDC048663]|uniref:hypothetical protein n=1 Tax=Streptomyces sp. NPDC048663 TaxID=3155638 RepID=UPI00344A9207